MILIYIIFLDSIELERLALETMGESCMHKINICIEMLILSY